jgi:hypothetical protein
MLTNPYDPRFMPKDVKPYPSNNYPSFEMWFWDNYTRKEDDRYPLPVYWTDYYRKNNYGKDKRAMKELQDYLESLPRELSYFTVVQYDDGILNDISHLDCKVFAMSGTPTFGNTVHRDNILPLVGQPYPTLPPMERDISVSFVGSPTHPIRGEMAEVFSRFEGSFIQITGSMAPETYHEVLARSVFALCPRGYGPTSFRISEAVRQGAIPIYISDDFWVPMGHDFALYGILMTPEQMREEANNDISTLMARSFRYGSPIGESEALKRAYSFEGCMEYVRRNITFPTSTYGGISGTETP